MAIDLGPILAKHRKDPTRLVQILHDVQRADGGITPDAITALAAGLGMPRARVEGTANFYSFFATGPKARYRVLFSHNVTDVMAGSVALRDRLLKAFNLDLGGTTHDGLVSIDQTSCTGLCDQGPALLVNGRAIPRLTPARIGAISALIRGGSPVEAWPENLFQIDAHIERRDIVLSTPVPRGEALRSAVARGAAASIEEMKQSGLRGRGGAGFSTGMKWEACRNAPGQQRFVVCNADEGEPGTFKDRVLLSEYADAVFEGMTVAAFTVGASQGFLYLRGEYLFLLPHLERVLASRRAQGLLGRNVGGVDGFHFDIEIHLGAGAYVCGEEGALIESLEGKRGIPRRRPPYPITRGYLGDPTIVNNVETLVNAALIARYGAPWWKRRGTAKSAGTRVMSVSGDVARPGIYEYPFGVTIAQVLEDAGATNTHAVMVGGPSGVLVNAHELKRKVAFEDVPCAGAFMVFDATRDIIEIVRNFAHFFAHESCGFCTPCRVGTTLQAQMLDRMAAGKGTRRDLKDLDRVARLMKATSHCGLGGTAGNPVLDALDRFRPAFEGCLASLEVMPVFDLDEALAPAREVTGRDDAGAHLSEDGE